jgi:hypothetical protein
MPNFFKAFIPVVPLITPMAVRWVRHQESIICATGEPLTPAQLHDAVHAGIQHPAKIRLKFVDSIPMPTHPLLLNLGKWTGLVSKSTAGITLRYGIYIRNEYRTDRHLLVHEFVHVSQYERLGSIEAFLRPYLKECLDPGYPLGPLEQEAILRADRIVR